MRMIRVTAMAAMLAAVLPSSEAAMSVDQVVDTLLKVERRFIDALASLPRWDYETCRNRDFCELTMCGTDNENQGQALTGGEARAFSCDIFPGSSNTAGCAATGGGIDSDPSCQAGWLNADRASTLFLPPGVKDNERLSEFVCGGDALNAYLRTVGFFGYHNFDGSIDRTRSHRDDGLLFGYAATVHANTGAFRTYPGILTKGTPQECAAQDFDPRLKPWFVAAATGPKDIVLVVDRSGSMGTPSNSSVATSPSRMDVTKNAFKRLLTTYTASDNVAVVAFNRTAEILGPRQGTIHGTEANLALLQAALDPLEAAGGTNYTEALTAAFQALQNPPDSDPGCTKMIVFLTDGLPNDEPEAIKAKLAELQASQGEAIIDKVMLFTVGMATLEGQDILQQLACENRGAWSFVNDGEDPLEKMAGYFDLAAAANPPAGNSAIGPTGVRCTNPYEDDFGLGTVVTCGYPHFYQPGGESGQTVTINPLDSFRMIDSVLGVDVIRATFGDTSLSVIEAGVRKFNRRVDQCERQFPLTECALQMIRGNATRVEPYNCPAPAPVVANCPIFTHAGNTEELPAILNYRGLYTYGWRAQVQRGQKTWESQQEIPTVASLLCEAWDFEKGIPQVIPEGKETRTDCCCYTGPLDGAVIPGTAAAMPAGSTLQAAAIAAVVAVVGCLIAA